MVKQVKTHIVEQRESDGMCFPVEKVYVVRQWQPEENYMGCPCGVYTDYDMAVEVMKQLNKEYSYGMKWNVGEKYISGEVSEDAWGDAYHYYDIDTLTLNGTDCL